MSSQTFNTNSQSESGPEIPTDPESRVKIYYIIGLANMNNQTFPNALSGYFQVPINVATQFVEHYSVFATILDMHKTHTAAILSFNTSPLPPNPQPPHTQRKARAPSPRVPSPPPEDPVFHPPPVIKAPNHLERLAYINKRLGNSSTNNMKRTKPTTPTAPTTTKTPPSHQQTLPNTPTMTTSTLNTDTSTSPYTTEDFQPTGKSFFCKGCNQRHAPKQHDPTARPICRKCSSTHSTSVRHPWGEHLAPPTTDDAPKTTAPSSTSPTSKSAATPVTHPNKNPLLLST